MNATGDIEKLVSSLTDISSGHKLLSIVIMYIIGLIVTLGNWFIICNDSYNCDIIYHLVLPLGFTMAQSL